MQEYRVAAVQDCPPASHSDFLFRSVIAVVIRQSDQRMFRLKLRSILGLKEGQVVRLDHAVVHTSQMAP